MMDDGQMVIKDGWVEDVHKVPSPNFNERPEGMPLDLIVVHSISLPPAEFGTGAILDFFQNRLDPKAHPYYEEIADLKVSSHFLIERQGRIVQFVPTHLRAWHAGESIYEGRKNCNDFSLGIELEGTEDSPFEEIQYQRLVWLIRGLMTHYASLSEDRIVGHSHVAPGRKKDPGEKFDWSHLHRLLKMFKTPVS